MTWRGAVVSDPTRDKRHELARAASECAAWQLWLEGQGLADRTREDYLRDVADLLRTNPALALEEFTDAHVMAVIMRRPPASRPRVRSSLASFFGWAKLTRRIADNPMDYVPRPRRGGARVPEVFSDAELALLYAADRLMVVLGETGIRKSEARFLQRRHVDLEHAELVVYRGKGGKDRKIPLTARAYTALEELVTLEGLDAGDYFWPTRPGGGQVTRRDAPAGNGTFHRWWVATLERAGIAYRNPHTMRHTFATRLIRAGARIENVQLLLGHTSIRTTIDLYGHLDVEDARADLRLLEIEV